MVELARKILIEEIAPRKNIIDTVVNGGTREYDMLQTAVAEYIELQTVADGLAEMKRDERARELIREIASCTAMQDILAMLRAKKTANDPLMKLLIDLLESWHGRALDWT